MDRYRYEEHLKNMSKERLIAMLMMRWDVDEEFIKRAKREEETMLKNLREMKCS